MPNLVKAEQLWRWDELVAASGGVADGVPAGKIAGFSIDSRAISRGDVFVALKDQRDGHDFVTSAFASGAIAALVSTAYARKPGDGALVRVDDTLRGLESIGRAARARLSAEARVIAVTGSAGKTTTKEMLRACLARIGPTHAPEKSYNNHWGVPLTLARMPAATQFGVFEIGMNHAGEITPLTKLVRPHVAIITNVLPVHLGNFANEEGIADAKAEIFAGLEPGGVALLNIDNPHFELLASILERCCGAGAKGISFGKDENADVRLRTADLEVDRSEVEIGINHPVEASADAPAWVVGEGADLLLETGFRYTIGAPGEHYVMNSLAVAGALDAAGVDLDKALAALSDFKAPTGRGQREEIGTASARILLIDESYNANPASMRAALAALALLPRGLYARRIAVLGDMLELGERSAELHTGLKEAIDAAGIDLVFAAGPSMRGLFERLESRQRGAWAQTSDDLRAALLAGISGGDAVMIKGSLGSRMGPLVTALRGQFGGV